MKISELKREHQRHIKEHYTRLYRLKFPWADDDFLDTLIVHSCREMVEEMDLNAYLSDLKTLDEEQTDLF